METQSDWNWIKIVWPFVLTVVLTVGLCVFSMDTLSSGRALVQGESLYSKAQKNSAVWLNQYLRSHAPADYQRFELALAVPLGDRKARLALNLNPPDLAAARQGFLEGDNHPEDIDSVIRLYRHFRYLDSVQQALALWAEADAIIKEMQEQGQQMKTLIEAGADERALRPGMARIDLLNARISPIGNAFSNSLGSGTRLAAQLLIILTILISGVLLILVLTFARHILLKIKRYESALRLSEGRFNLTMLSSGDGVWDWDRCDNRVYYSPFMKQLLGYNSEHQDHQAPYYFLQTVHPADRTLLRAALVLHVRQRQPYHAEIRIITRTGLTRWVCVRAESERDAKGKTMRLAGTLRDITDVKTAAGEIKLLAFYDNLTQLPNRQLLMDRLSQALLAGTRSKKNGALLFIDLDNFKTLNDTQGHDCGDLLLQQTARRLVASVRGSDTVARLGGDEFVILLDNLSSAPHEAALQAKDVGEKILSALNHPYQLAGNLHHSSCSIGITLFDDPQEKIGEFLKRADLAMYQAKAAGRNTLRFFNPAMQTAVSLRALLIEELRQGAPLKQFVLYYQPQMNRSGHMTGVEALLRWRHPVRGMVAPQEFIALAEETGIIVQLGLWALEQACWQLVAWSRHAATMHLTMAVNVSVRQFRHPDFVAQVSAILKQTGAWPQRLKLELTEDLLTDDLEATIAKMSVLKAKGIRFALDDFGTGASSLYYLQRLPLDQLKIDQTFVRDVVNNINDAAIARTIVALASNLGLEVIAEGVETEGQYSFLARNGCYAYQGYLFSRPLPLDELEQFMANALTGSENA